MKRFLKKIKSFLAFLWPNRANRTWKKSRGGRAYGWYIELDGETLGELVGCEFEDMFWDSYRLIAKDEASHKILSNSTLWDNCRFQFRNKYNLLYAANVLSAGGKGAASDGRIAMRGLYILEEDWIDP